MSSKGQSDVTPTESPQRDNRKPTSVSDLCTFAYCNFFSLTMLSPNRPACRFLTLSSAMVELGIWLTTALTFCLDRVLRVGKADSPCLYVCGTNVRQQLVFVRSRSQTANILDARSLGARLTTHRLCLTSGWSAVICGSPSITSRPAPKICSSSSALTSASVSIMGL